MPASELLKLGATASTIRPGMLAEVVIMTRRRTAPAYLTEPFIKRLWRSGNDQ